MVSCVFARGAAALLLSQDTHLDHQPQHLRVIDDAEHLLVARVVCRDLRFAKGEAVEPHSKANGSRCGDRPSSRQLGRTPTLRLPRLDAHRLQRVLARLAQLDVRLSLGWLLVLCRATRSGACRLICSSGSKRSRPSIVTWSDAPPEADLSCSDLNAANCSVYLGAAHGGKQGWRVLAVYEKAQRRARGFERLTPRRRA